MKIKYSFICEATNVSQNGNLNVLGIFRNISSLTFPFTFPKLFYVASIEFLPDEIGTHHFKLNFINDDGQHILTPLQGEIHISEATQWSNLILGIENVVFSKPGTYEINMFIGNILVASENIAIVLS